MIKPVLTKDNPNLHKKGKAPSDENRNQCVVCDSYDTAKYILLKSNNLDARRCKKCGHIFVINSPINSDNIADYYTMGDFKGQRTLQDIEYPDYYSDCFRDYERRSDSSLVLKQFQEKADYIASLFPDGGRLLDVGCATGVFLDMMRKKGWDAEGLEISEELASYARKTFSLKVHVKDLTSETLDVSPFNVITLFDVIEHVPDPNLMIASCLELLDKNGILLLRTPTEEGFLRSIAKAMYRLSLKKLELPMLWFYSFEHIQSFSLHTLNTLLEKHHFSTFKVIREEESLERISIPGYIRITMQGINSLASLLNKQHKITVFARKC